MSDSEVSTNADSDTSDETTREAARSLTYMGLSVTTLVVSGVIMGFAQSYDLAYTAPLGDVTEKQGYLIDKCRHSWMLACAGTVFGPIAAIAEYRFRDAAKAESVEAVCQDGHHGSDLSEKSHGTVDTLDKLRGYKPKKTSQLRLALALLVTLIIACVSIAYAYQMWDKGVKPMVTVMHRYKNKKPKPKGRKKGRKKWHKYVWEEEKFRKTCRQAMMSHCDKLEKLHYSLIAGAIISGVFFLFVCWCSWNNFKMEKKISKLRNGPASTVSRHGRSRR